MPEGASDELKHGFADGRAAFHRTRIRQESGTPVNELRKQFLRDHLLFTEGFMPKVLVTACRLPSGAIETAENREFIREKLDYIATEYDDDFRLKRNPLVQIVGYMIV